MPESTSLYASATGTIADVVDETDATSDLHLSVDDDPDSPNDADWINNAAALVGSDEVTLSGAVFSSPPSYNSGTVTAGNVTLAGVVFSASPSFVSGVVSQGAGGSIELDATSEGEQLNGTSLTISHTCTGSDLILFAAVVTFDTEFGASAQLPTATYDGEAMTQWGTILFNSDDQRITVFYKTNPSTGANDIVFSLSGDADDMAGIGVSYTGVNQSTPVDTAVTKATTGTESTQDVTSETGDLVVDFIGMYNADNLAVGADQTVAIYNNNGSSDDSVASSNEAGGTTVTMSWATDASEVFGHVAGNVNN